MTSTAYGPAVRSPASEAGSVEPATQQRGHAEDRRAGQPRGAQARSNSFTAPSVPSRSGRKPTSQSLPRCARLPTCSASCFAFERLDRAVLALDARDDERLAVGSGHARRASRLSGRAMSCTPTPPFGRSGISSSGNTQQSRVGGERGHEFLASRRSQQALCTFAPSSTLMKSLPWRVFVARSPSLQRKPRPAELFMSSVLLQVADAHPDDVVGRRS